MTPSDGLLGLLLGEGLNDNCDHHHQRQQQQQGGQQELNNICDNHHQKQQQQQGGQGSQMKQQQQQQQSLKSGLSPLAREFTLPTTTTTTTTSSSSSKGVSSNTHTAAVTEANAFEDWNLNLNETYAADDDEGFDPSSLVVAAQSGGLESSLLWADFTTHFAASASAAGDDEAAAAVAALADPAIAALLQEVGGVQGFKATARAAAGAEGTVAQAAVPAGGGGGRGGKGVEVEGLGLTAEQHELLIAQQEALWAEAQASGKKGGKGGAAAGGGSGGVALGVGGYRTPPLSAAAAGGGGKGGLGGGVGNSSKSGTGGEQLPGVWGLLCGRQEAGRAPSPAASAAVGGPSAAAGGTGGEAWYDAGAAGGYGVNEWEEGGYSYGYHSANYGSTEYWEQQEGQGDGGGGLGYEEYGGYAEEEGWEDQEVTQQQGDGSGGLGYEGQGEEEEGWDAQEIAEQQAAWARFEQVRAAGAGAAGGCAAAAGGGGGGGASFAGGGGGGNNSLDAGYAVLGGGGVNSWQQQHRQLPVPSKIQQQKEKLRQWELRKAAVAAEREGMQQQQQVGQQQQQQPQQRGRLSGGGGGEVGPRPDFESPADLPGLPWPEGPPEPPAGVWQQAGGKEKQGFKGYPSPSKGLGGRGVMTSPGQVGRRRGGLVSPGGVKVLRAAKGGAQDWPEVGQKGGGEEWEQWPGDEVEQAVGDSGFRATTADLHWDLVMEGLTPMKGGKAEGEGLNPSIGAADGATGQRTRELIAAQQAAAVAGGGGGGAVAGRGAAANANAGGAGGPGLVRDGASQATMLSMMAKAARKHQRQQGGGENLGVLAPGVLELRKLYDWLDEMRSQGAGAKRYGYEWAGLFEVMREGGWVPQLGGGGGKHFKFKRQLPACGKVQVLTMPCTPSDVLRSVKCAASNVARRDQEAWELEGVALGLLPA